MAQTLADVPPRHARVGLRGASGVLVGLFVPKERFKITAAIEYVCYQDKIVGDDIRNDRRVFERYGAQSREEIIPCTSSAWCVADALTASFNTQDKTQSEIRCAATFNNVSKYVGQIVFGAITVLDLKPLNHRNVLSIARRVPSDGS